MIPRFRLIPALLIAFAAAGFVYGSLLFRATPLERDDQLFVPPLESVHGPADYFRDWRQGRILDVAPVRDLSYFLDLGLGRAVGHPTYALTNIFLWITFVAIAILLFRDLGFGDAALWALLTLLVAHPIYAVSVAWISARKHLLAGIFALAASRLVVKPPRKGARAWPALLYALSVLSHPIHLLWPVWAWAYGSFSRGPEKAAANLWPSWAMMAVLGALNAWYYATIYVAASGLTKFSAEGGPGTAVLAFGRAALNLLAPYALSPVDYYPGSTLSFAGLAALVPLAWILWRSLPKRILVPWSLFFVLPLLLLNVRPTRVFLSDTYLLLPSLGLWVLLFEALRDRIRVALAFVAALAVPGLLAARLIASSFLSMDDLFALAYAREATPQVSAVHARYLFERGYLREAAEISFNAIPDFPAAETVFAQAVADDKRLDPERRIELLRKAPGHDPLLHFFLARTLAETGRYGEAYGEIAPGLNHLSSFGDASPLVAHEALEWAEKAGRRTPALDAAIKAQLPGGSP